MNSPTSLARPVSQVLHQGAEAHGAHVLRVSLSPAPVKRGAEGGRGREAGREGGREGEREREGEGTIERDRERDGEGWRGIGRERWIEREREGCRGRERGREEGRGREKD